MCSHLSNSPGCQKFRKIASCHEKKKKKSKLVAESQQKHTASVGHGSVTLPANSTGCNARYGSTAGEAKDTALPETDQETVTRQSQEGHRSLCESQPQMLPPPKAPDDPALLQASCSQNNEECPGKAPDLPPVSTSTRFCDTNTNPGPRRNK